MPSREDSPHKASLQRSRFLIAAGTSHYDRLPEDAQLPSVEQDLRSIGDLFCDGLHYENALPDLKVNPKKEVFRQTLRDWIRNKDRNESDVVVIYYSGHGDIEGDRHYLLTTDSDPEDLLDTAVPTEDLARRIANSSVRLVLLLIDTCYAGSGSGDIAKVVSGIRGLFSRENVGFFVIAAARPKEEARQGVLVEALTSVFSDERLAGTLQEFLLPMAVSTAINRYFLSKNLSQLTMAYETYAGYEDPPFFPNPRYRPSIPVGVDLKTQRQLSSMEQEDILLHWGPRGRGVEIESQAGWYFTGRTRILRDLVRWLKTPTADAMPQVITGDPGVGKSAVLARLVTMADPEYEPRAPLEDVDPDTIPPENSITVAVHAKGKTPGEIVRAMPGDRFRLSGSGRSCARLSWAKRTGHDCNRRFG
jgi:Caspase domain